MKLATTVFIILVSIDVFALAAVIKGDESSGQCLQPDKPYLLKNPMGDPRYCIFAKNKDLLRMEVLTGTGWDNLRNLNMGMVFLKNYSRCLTSEDGKYLIPDNTYVVPLKESNVAFNSEYFDHWSNYSSMTSRSINVEVGIDFPKVQLGGKYSSEYQSVKKHQVNYKAVTTRSQLRYKLYTVKLQPDMQLHPDLKSRLLDIAAHLQCNNKAMARYMADLIVRDYGTHYITSIDAGAILAKVDHINATYAANFKMNKRSITVSASASFFQMFRFSASYTRQVKKEDLNTYLHNIVYSKIHTYGGPPFRVNFSVDQWEDDLPNNLVAIDRSGDPLHYAITPDTLPELPEALAFELSRFVFQSIKRYYNHNIIKGCTDVNSPNFNFQAILDDHSCESPYNNFTFGGVYQECTVSGSSSTEFCGDFLQKNPKTNDYACPAGYKSVLVHRGLAPTTCHRKCYWWIIFQICHNDCGQASYSTYWCVAKGVVKDHSGYLFGALYSKISVNPLTGSASCPPMFYPQRFGPEGMYVCISDDYELGSKYSLPFAGFFSCSAGNPLALKTTLVLSDGHGLESRLYNAGSPSWPKRCPTGYSQHLAIIDDNCEINYCIKAHALSEQGLPYAKRPPFRLPPKMSHNITIPLAIFNDDSRKIWLREPGSLNWMLVTKGVVMKHLAENDTNIGSVDNLKASFGKIYGDSPASGGSKGTNTSAGAAVGTTIGAIAITALLIIVVTIVRRRKRKEGKNAFISPLLPSKSYHSMSDTALGISSN